jgi:hypothetical protein
VKTKTAQKFQRRKTGVLAPLPKENTRNELLMSVEKFNSRERESLDFHPQLSKESFYSKNISTEESTERQPKTLHKSAPGHSITQYLKSVEVPKSKQNSLNPPKSSLKLQEWINETLRHSRTLLERKAITRALLPASAGDTVDIESVKYMDAVRALGIDRATFEAFGIDPETQRKIYRGLYVATQSIFDLMEDVT